MNTTIKTLLALALMLAVTTTAQAGVKKIGTVNGLTIYRIKTAGVFAPSTTTIVAVDTNKPGTIEGVLNGTGGPGFVPAVATAGGIVGGAALLRPARSNTNVQQSGGGATSVGVGGNSNASGGAGGSGGNGGDGGNGGSGNFIPPGHVNNPSGNH